MKVSELVAKLNELDDEQEVYIYEALRNEDGIPIDGSYREIDYIEQWSDDPECSNHYTIFAGDLVSG